MTSVKLINHSSSTADWNYFIKNQITNRSICTAGSTCCKHSFPEYESIYFCFPTSPCCCFNICNNKFLEERLNRTGRFQSNLPRSTIVCPIFPRTQKDIIRICDQLSIIVIISRTIPRQICFLHFRFKYSIRIICSFKTLHFLHITFHGSSQRGVPIHFGNNGKTFRRQGGFNGSNNCRINRNIHTISHKGIYLCSGHVSEILIFQCSRLHTCHLFDKILCGP